jgi:cell division septation protein DedD
VTLGNAGHISAARLLADSLAKAAKSDSPDFADILFARATFAPSVLDASLDYEKIVSEFPGSRAAKASLLRLAQRALISSDATKAGEYLQRILREYPDEASVAEAQYWRSRALREAHDITAACLASREAAAHAAATPALAQTIASENVAACGTSDSVRSGAPAVTAQKPVVVNSAAVTDVRPKPTAGRYAVQVAAFPKRPDAEAMAERLRRRGLEAHVDGNTSPFRVRIGHYASYADAAKELRALKSVKIAGFVSETKE